METALHQQQAIVEDPRVTLCSVSPNKTVPVAGSVVGETALLSAALR
jgi:hypothetical protein